MLFYAAPIPDSNMIKMSIERPVEDTLEDQAPSMLINANNGHMSMLYDVEPADVKLARRVWKDFKQYEDAITIVRLARYWAAFRNSLEVYLVRKHRCKIDQRYFDTMVYLAMCNSFFQWWDRVCRLRKDKKEAAYRMLCYISQGFAKAVAASIEVSVLWHKPDLFIEPACAENGQEQQCSTWGSKLGGYGGVYPPGFGNFQKAGKYQPYGGGSHPVKQGSGLHGQYSPPGFLAHKQKHLSAKGSPFSPWLFKNHYNTCSAR